MEVLILTVACGVGKTTTAKAWAKRHQGAIIECDYFTEWICNDDFPHWKPAEERFVVRMALSVCREYLSAGMPVAIENVWTPDGVDQLINGLESLAGVTKVIPVYLQCRKDINHLRDQQRLPENQMGKRVDVVDQQLRSYQWPEQVQILDTSDLNLNQVIDRIAAW